MSSSGTPAGWYPDPENPGQSRYWDGTAWAAPSGVPATPHPPAAGGGSSGGKIALIVVGVLLVLGLITGGVLALTGGDDGDDDVTTGTDDDDDDDDDGDGPEELDEAEFIAVADGICSDLEDDLDSTADEFFADVDTEDIDDIDPDLLAEWRDAMLDVTEEYFPELRAVTPEGDADAWLDLVDDWENVYQDLIETLAESDFEVGDELEDRYDDIEDAVEEFGLECLSSGSMADEATGMSPEPVEPPDLDVDGDAGPPSPPPSFDDSSLEPLGDDCYQGDMDACDQLFFDSGFDTPEEEYGDTCGGRTEGGPSCLSIEDPIEP